MTCVRLQSVILLLMHPWRFKELKTKWIKRTCRFMKIENEREKYERIFLDSWIKDELIASCCWFQFQLRASWHARVSWNFTTARCSRNLSILIRYYAVGKNSSRCSWEHTSEPFDTHVHYKHFPGTIQDFPVAGSVCQHSSSHCSPIFKISCALCHRMPSLHHFVNSSARPSFLMWITRKTSLENDVLSNICLSSFPLSLIQSTSSRLSIIESFS